MGTPIKIADMAKDLIKLSGFEPDVDIKIEYTGLRLGEKMFEELVTEGEGIIATSHEKIMVLHGTDCEMDFINEHIDIDVISQYEQFVFGKSFHHFT